MTDLFTKSNLSWESLLELGRRLTFAAFSRPQVAACPANHAIVLPNGLTALTLRLKGWGWMRMRVRLRVRGRGRHDFPRWRFFWCATTLDFSVPADMPLTVLAFNSFGWRSMSLAVRATETCGPAVTTSLTIEPFGTAPPLFLNTRCRKAFSPGSLSKKKFPRALTVVSQPLTVPDQFGERHFSPPGSADAAPRALPHEVLTALAAIRADR